LQWWAHQDLHAGRVGHLAPHVHEVKVSQPA
jgi:hypothetical protein